MSLVSFVRKENINEYKTLKPETTEAADDLRPTCINYGCTRKVAKSDKNRYRPVCSSCHKAGYGGGKFSPWIIPFRTGKCVNQTGFLGFPCPTNYDVEWVVGITEIDHIDGNHFNNTPENTQELCPMCHKRKGMLEGNYKQHGKYNKIYEAINGKK